MTLLAAWPLIRRFGPYVLGVLLLVGAYVWIYDHGRNAQRAKDAAQISALNQTIADTRAATAKAQADDAAHKQAVETAQTTVTENSNATLEKQLAAARADAAAYAQRLRDAAQTPARGSGSAAVPGAPVAAGPSDGAGQAAELDDDACAEAVTKSEAWQSWWTGVAAVPR